MERQKFEDSWKEAFENAEMSPSDNTWTNIELGIEKADGDKMKRRVLFFKMLAAASVVFAMGVASVSIYMLQEQQPQHIANNQPANHQATEETLASSPAQQTADPIQNTPSEATEKSSGTQQAPNTTQNNSSHSKREQQFRTADNNKNIHASGDKHTYITNGNDGTVQHQASEKHDNVVAMEQANTTAANLSERAEMSSTGLPRLVTPHQVTYQPASSEPDAVAIMLARMDQREEEVRQAAETSKKSKKKNNDEKLWTSVGFAAGSFNTVNANISPTGTNTFLASNTAMADAEADASGVAYSVGINLGTRIAKRWVLQGGVNYLSQSSDYSTEVAVGTADFQTFKIASINELDKLNFESEGHSNAKIVPTGQYTVNNQVQFISIPLQAGYMVVDRKFGIQLNAGLSTDLFIQNTKTAEGQDLDKITQGRGEDSPYRPLNFSGLAGTEFSYRFGSRYRLSLNPGIRYPFNSIYKSDLGVQSTPVTFDIGIRFRYIFH